MIDEALLRSKKIKTYLENSFCKEDSSIKFAREQAHELGFKQIEVPTKVGKMLYMLARLQSPQRILEIGTLGGYSTLWLAKALPASGKLLSLECNIDCVNLAKEHIARANLSHQVDILHGDACDLLEKLKNESVAAFDLIFIDADKEQYSIYLDGALKLARIGTLILSDNLIPKRGEITHPDPRDKEALAIYAYNQKIANHPQLESMLFPTIVGEKGRIDSLGVSIVTRI